MLIYYAFLLVTTKFINYNHQRMTSVDESTAKQGYDLRYSKTPTEHTRNHDPGTFNNVYT